MSRFYSDNQDFFIDNTFTDVTPLHTSANGYSEVYKAKRHGKWHVLKCLTKSEADNPEYQALLQKEFDVCFTLNHPFLVQTIGMEHVEGLGACIVEEYIDGTTWDEYFSNSDVTLDDAIRLVCELCDAIEYIHARQIIHRDLKPENVIITRNGHHPRLVDFGLADHDTYTILKAPAGSADYIAPEQRDASMNDCRCDIYSLGMMLSRLPMLSKPYQKIAGRCTMPVDKRYQTIQEVRTALTEVAQRKTKLQRYAKYAFFSALHILVALCIIWQVMQHSKGYQETNDNGISLSERIANQYDSQNKDMLMSALEHFLQQKQWLQTTIDKSLKQRDKFVADFPVTRLMSLPRSEYDMSNKNGFAYRIKYEMDWMGAFYGVDSKPYECQGYSAEQYQQHLADIVALLQAGAIGNKKAIKDNPLYGPLKYRLLTIYYPESSYMPFWLDNEVEHIVSVLLPDASVRSELTPANCFDSREILYNYKNAHPIMKEWDNFLFMDFVFMYYPKCARLYKEDIKKEQKDIEYPKVVDDLSTLPKP